MSVFADILPLLFSLAAIVLIMYLAFVFTRFLGNRMNNYSKFNNIKIIERVALGQDKTLVIADICGKYYLIGASNQTIEILTELDQVNDQVDLTKEQQPEFFQMIQKALHLQKEKSGNDHETEDK